MVPKVISPLIVLLCCCYNIFDEQKGKGRLQSGAQSSQTFASDVLMRRLGEKFLDVGIHKVNKDHAIDDDA